MFFCFFLNMGDIDDFLGYTMQTIEIDWETPCSMEN